MRPISRVFPELDSNQAHNFSSQPETQTCVMIVILSLAPMQPDRTTEIVPFMFESHQFGLFDACTTAYEAKYLCLKFTTLFSTKQALCLYNWISQELKVKS